MPRPEQQPHRHHPDEAKPLTLPAQLEDTEHKIQVAKTETGTLVVSVAQGEQLIFSASVTPTQDINLALADGRQVIFPAPVDRKPITHSSPPEVIRQPEYPPITIEGYPVRKASFDEEQRTFRLTIAHHPNPAERTQVVYYDLLADGKKAKECSSVGVVDTRTPVHATGDDHSRVVKKKDGSEKIVHEIRVDSLEKIREKRVDSPSVLRKKRKLTDLQ